jgi:SulP family sulfate permease
MALVLGLTVFWNLIAAVLVGVALAALAFIKRLADEQLKAFRNTGDHVATSDEERELLKQADGHILMFDFGGPLSFGAAADLGLQVRERAKEKGDAIILDFSNVPFMDVSAARAVETIICDANDAGRTAYVTGLSEEVDSVLKALDADHCLQANTTFETRVEALRAAFKELQKARGIGGGSPQPAAT